MTINVDATSGSSGALILGQSIWSPDILTDQRLHEYDGSQYSTTGIYADFVTDYLTDLQTNYPSRFKTEAEWQTLAVTNDIVNYWVLDTVNSVFRFPRIQNIAMSEAIAGNIPVAGTGISLGLTNGVINVGLDANGSATLLASSNAYGATVTNTTATTTGLNGVLGVTTDETKSGLIAKNTSENTTGYLYCVIATEPKTSAQIDIDEIATDLANKADKSLSNLTDAGNVYGSGFFAPSAYTTSLTLGATGTTYTAPANGWVSISKVGSAAYQELILSTGDIASVSICRAANQVAAAFIPVRKGQEFQVSYTTAGTLNWFKFIYARGSVSEYTP